jgi:hypothetical protein
MDFCVCAYKQIKTNNYLFIGLLFGGQGIPSKNAFLNNYFLFYFDDNNQNHDGMTVKFLL